jgi:murein DD-endopeptidase MepM/ murein hydrolase activator NlpD
MSVHDLHASAKDGSEMPQHNKHRKPRNGTRGSVAALTLTAGAAGIMVPMAIAPTASAAPLSAWDAIAECESNSRWDLPYGDADSTGGLQIQKRTWDDFDGPAITGAEYPSQATKAQQIQVAELILAQQGPDAWACNAKVGSPLSHADALGTDPAPTTAPLVEREPQLASTSSRSGTSRQADFGERRVHRVVPGDTLYKIALQYTQDPSVDNWRSFYRANETVIGNDPSRIRPGMMLDIPAPGPASAETEGLTQPTAPPSDPGGLTPPVPSANASYSLPVDAQVSQRFGNPSSGYTLGFHTGLDFSAPTGTPVRAAAAGTVVASDPSGSYGTNVQIEHDDGTYTLYAHLAFAKLVEGDRVAAGDGVGYVGTTGNSSGPHLHFEVRTAPTFAAGNFLDPSDWLGQHGITV